MPDSKRTSLDEIRSLGRAELNKVAEEEGLFGNAPRSVLMSFETEDGQRYDVTASEVSELLNPAPGASIIWPNIFTTDAAGRIIQRPLGLSIREFIRLFLAEIRKRICKNKTLGHATTGALAALAIWLA
jgi:hypothetical protein